MEFNYWEALQMVRDQCGDHVGPGNNFGSQLIKYSEEIEKMNVTPLKVIPIS